MNARLKAILGYGALIAVSFFVSAYWPDEAHAIIAGLGFVFLAALIGGLFWIVGWPATERLIEAWEGGYPTMLHASRKNPPWEVPRTLSSTGSANDRADYRILQPRLTLVPGAIPDAILREIPDSVLRNDYFEPSLYLDRETGQYWVEFGYEVGFNQWTCLIPVRPPE